MYKEEKSDCPGNYCPLTQLGQSGTDLPENRFAIKVDGLSQLLATQAFKLGPFPEVQHLLLFLVCT